MKARTFIQFATLMTLILILLTGCGGGGGSDDGTAIPVYRGSWYETGYEWPHDGNPYESENLIVYSDAAGLEARQFLSETGESILADLKEQFDLTDDSVFQFPAGQDKIHIYAYKNYFPQDWGGQAYLSGFMIFSPDHPERTEFGHTALEVYEPVIKHELVHVIQNLIIGVVDPTLMDVWFMEGIAEELSESNLDRSVDSWHRLNELISTYGALNPISMKLYDYPDIEGVITFYYYPMFQLAAVYLIDENGLGNSSVEIVNTFYDVRDGITFETSFENNFGISLDDYHREFFELMESYLP